MITEEDKDKIRQLIMSDDVGNVIIGVKIAKNVLGMNAKQIKALITIHDVKPILNQYNNLQGYELYAFGKRYWGNIRSSAYSVYNDYCKLSVITIQKLIYDLD